MPNEYSYETNVTFTNIVEQCNRHQYTDFLTITLKPKLYKYSSITQLELTNNVLFNILYRHTIDFAVVSEHTQNANIHYHCVISFRDKHDTIALINFLKKSKDFGFIKLDKCVHNIIRCAEYMTKDLYITARTFCSVPGHKPDFSMTHRKWCELTSFNQ